MDRTAVVIRMVAMSSSLTWMRNMAEPPMKHWMIPYRQTVS